MEDKEKEPIEVEPEKVEIEGAVIEETKEEQDSKVVPEENKNKMAIASLVLGIISIVVIDNFFVSLVCAILAIVFGIQGKKEDRSKMATAGFILGIITVSLLALCMIGIFQVAWLFTSLL